MLISENKYFAIEWRTMGTSVKITPKTNFTFAFLSDIHFPFHDPVALSLAKQILRRLRPQLVILGGDIHDFFAISRFDSSPQRRLMLADEISVVRKELKSLFSSLPQSTVWIYLAGNHEERLRRFLWQKAPELSTLEELSLPALYHLPPQVIYLDFQDTPQKIGDDVEPCVDFGEHLIVLHGSKIRMSGNTINVALGIFRRTLLNTIVGHWHRHDEYIQTDYRGRTKGVWVTPCLCLPRPHWDSGRIWGQGMTIVTINSSGFFKVDVINFIRTDGKLLAFWNGKEFVEEVR